MKSKFWQKIVDASSGLIAKMINKELPKISEVVDSKIQALNKEIASEGPLTFAIPITKDLEINLAMTQSPDLNTQDLI
jgi:hypothetical protein